MSIQGTLKHIYRSIVPKKIRQSVYSIYESYYNSALKKKILLYYKQLPAEAITEEHAAVLGYLEKNPLSIFPYSFYNKYLDTEVKVQRSAEGFPYVLHHNKKLFFKQSWTNKRVQEYYISLLAEQDAKSPHRYLETPFLITAGDVIADVGCAEGNFSLDAVEVAKSIYLFEADPEWIAPLNLTFAPWKEKVHIINKFVSNQDDQDNIALDTLFGRDNPLSFIKIDAEGSETDILAGGKQLLETQDQLSIAICTYHRQQDESLFRSLLERNHFDITVPHGFMIFFYDRTIAPPYLRRGLIRARKQSNAVT